MEKSTAIPPRPPTTAIEEKLGHAIKEDRNLTTILNGHLALEHTIEASCRKKLLEPKEIFADHNFGFALKLKLLKGLFGSEIDRSIYTACSKLNKLRNEMAHELASSQAKQLQFDLLILPLPTMKGQKSADLEAMEPNLLMELTFYKIHAIIRDILNVSFAAEIEEYDTEMREWLDTTK